MKILVAGPGTGKTTKVIDFINQAKTSGKVLVLSFTNATINSLFKAFEKKGLDIGPNECMTLHKCAMKLRQRFDLEILNNAEEKIIEKYAKILNVSVDDLCKILGCITYKQMISHTVQYIKANPVHVQNKLGEIDLLIVDEYQDFNKEERNLIDLLVEFAKEVIFLGDDDQSIYEFKNATADAIIALYGKLEKISHDNICHRCPDSVIKVCNNLISKNKKRIPKEWKSKGKKGFAIHKQTNTQEQTVEYLYKAIQKIQKNDPNSSSLILSAIQLPSKEIIDFFEKNSIKHNNQWVGKISLEKLVLLWELRVLLGKNKIANLIFLMDNQNASQYKRGKFNKYLKKNITSGLDEEQFIDEICSHNALNPDFVGLIKNNATKDEIFECERYSEIQDSIDITKSVENQIQSLLKELEIVQEFDEHGINVMSIHKSKGLQADYVFILGLVNGILPNNVEGMDSLEMQRRLVFVAMSRARKGLFLISTISWDGSKLRKNGKQVDINKFRFNRMTSKQEAESSDFISEMGIL